MISSAASKRWTGCRTCGGPFQIYGPSGRVIQKRNSRMNRVIYIVGLIVVVLAILSFFGLR